MKVLVLAALLGGCASFMEPVVSEPVAVTPAVTPVVVAPIEEAPYFEAITPDNLSVKAPWCYQAWKALEIRGFNELKGKWAYHLIDCRPLSSGDHRILARVVGGPDLQKGVTVVLGWPSKSFSFVQFDSSWVDITVGPRFNEMGSGKEEDQCGHHFAALKSVPSVGIYCIGAVRNLADTGMRLTFGWTKVN